METHSLHALAFMNASLVGLQYAFDRGCTAIERSETLNLLMQSAYEIQKPRFRTEFSFDQRSAEAQRQRQKYPDRVPIVVEEDPRSRPIREADAKRKFLVPQDMTFGAFMFTIRKRAKLEAHQALFLFVERQERDGTVSSTLPPTGLPIGLLYTGHRDPDGFVYLVVSAENVFGCDAL